MSGTNNSNDINVQSGLDMGFGGGFGPGDISTNVGAAMDATGSLGGGLGLTDAQGADLGAQVAVGPSTGNPGGGQFSKTGAIVGGIAGALMGMPVQGVLAGGYGTGYVNDLFGWSSSKPEMPDIGFGTSTYGGGSGGNAGISSSGGAVNELFRPDLLASGATTSPTATSDEASRWVAAGLLDAATGQPTTAGWQAINAARAQAGQSATGTTYS